MAFDDFTNGFCVEQTSGRRNERKQCCATSRPHRPSGRGISSSVAGCAVIRSHPRNTSQRWKDYLAYGAILSGCTMHRRHWCPTLTLQPVLASDGSDQGFRQDERHGRSISINHKTPSISLAELEGGEAAINAVFNGLQFVVGAGFHHTPTGNDDDSIHVPHGGKPVGDDK